MDIFNEKDYICKFFYCKYDYAHTSDYIQRISADMYRKELKIEILNKTGSVIDVFGYKLSQKMDKLLPLIKWEDFEKARDISGWNLDNNGYRDGWWYEFVCMNESGNPLIRNYLDVTFEEQKSPAYEKLLSWVIRECSEKKEIKKYNLIW